jgi:hypothetical protein
MKASAMYQETHKSGWHMRQIPDHEQNIVMFSYERFDIVILPNSGWVPQWHVPNKEYDKDKPVRIEFEANLCWITDSYEGKFAQPAVFPTVESAIRFIEAGGCFNDKFTEIERLQLYWKFTRGY